jgi:hypothetical protein
MGGGTWWREKGRGEVALGVPEKNKRRGRKRKTATTGQHPF